MKRTVMLLSSAALVLSFAAAEPARAGSPPNAAVQGTWAFGSNVQESGLRQSNGTLTFDGNGGVTGIITYNNDGTVCQGMSVSGTYNVNPGKLSGTAVMTVASVNTSNCALTGDGDTLSIAFSMFNSLKGINFMETDAQSVGYFYDSFGSPLFGVATHF
jgi:hypothetical protein